VRLRQLVSELGDRVTLRVRAFPLRPEPDPTVTFAGTHREAGWRRAQDLAGDTGVTFRMWTRADYPRWSLPALEAAKCVALQGAAAFEAVHLALYRAFFGEGVNIAEPGEVAGVIRQVPGVDVDRFAADYAAGRGRQAVLDDYREALETHGVRAIPTVIIPDGALGRRVVGAVPLAEYRRLLGA
jgi:predicted DsbA family dithiol-disulfide isomerase